MRREIAILHAPSPLGLKPPAEGRVPGVRLMPEALRRAGLHEFLSAAYAGEVVPPPYVPDPDPELRVRNPHAIATHSVELANEIGVLLDSPPFPLVLGGDCSILIGAALALRRRGRFGVLYVDAHPDCLTPETSETGGVAGMPLAVVTGRGPDLLTNLEGRRPYIAETDAVVVGCRDLYEVTGTSEKWVGTSRIRVRDLEEVRLRGPERLAAEVVRELAETGVDGIWVHIDADVLDETIMPAVDSPEPGGMSPAELTSLLAPLVASPMVRGLEITIYDPERDPGGRAAEVLVDVLGEAFGLARRTRASR